MTGGGRFGPVFRKLATINVPQCPLSRLSHIWRRTLATTRFIAEADGHRAVATWERKTSMSDFDRNIAARGSYGAGTAAVVDAGLRAYMIRVYNYMAAGVALTGVVAWLTYNAAVVTGPNGAITGLTSFGQAIFSGPLA